MKLLIASDIISDCLGNLVCLTMGYAPIVAISRGKMMSVSLDLTIVVFPTAIHSPIWRCPKCPAFSFIVHEAGPQQGPVFKQKSNQDAWSIPICFTAAFGALCHFETFPRMLSDPSNRPRLSLSSPKASWVPWGAVCQGYRSNHLVRQNGWVNLKKPDMNGYLWLKSMFYVLRVLSKGGKSIHSSRWSTKHLLPKAWQQVLTTTATSIWLPHGCFFLITNQKMKKTTQVLSRIYMFYWCTFW